jgi:YidC/Oxa1 family membrane protein insertase
VLLVRAILHPLTKHQQITMAKMQQKQASVQPKIAALKAKYPNDKQKLQLETMRVYREAGINPAGQIAGCLPMLIQLPIWVALYSALNYDINLWHSPFMFWIRDLSAPDALVSWHPATEIPLLSWMIGPVDKFNLLPILLAGSMWLQQKYTPKPTPAPGTPPDQLAQQQQMQKMMGFMMVFMGIMFYNMPSGLNLYIMASSAFGALEQQRIRKHMEERKKDPDFAKPKGGGWMEKLMEMVEKKAATSHTYRKEKDE